ncbi:hypothetical protein RirG_198460 [Rhizophagus irregularis DAOM 197198w]|uniref:Protein kinase domain-containing protein n=1 Tax=Rhizophagus irregularis (strain DAOM 197198w) TaxID=1432141 RepID=A0A015IVS4_RHIIW|nr:hypothetical protein RirG_198460 [Rhizophagus irregularis DAOM 197198w]
MQSNIDRSSDIIFEWIPYDQFKDIKEIDKGVNVYSAIWKNGPLYYKKRTIFGKNKYVKSYTYSINYIYLSKLYGISQDPKTRDYILVFKHKTIDIMDTMKIITNWTSGNEKIDNLIQKMRLKFNETSNILFEWIPYDQFNNIKVIGRDEFATIYSAIWSDGPLHYDNYRFKYTRNMNEKVILKCLYNSYNSQNILDLNEVEVSSNKIYGVSQNSDTNDYIIVFIDGFHCRNCGKQFTQIYNKWCKQCQLSNLKNITIWASGNEKIDSFIQKMQLKINASWNIIFEWIPFEQFNDVKEIKSDDLTSISSAMWKNGQLYYDNNKYEYARNQNTKVKSYYSINRNSYMPEVLYGISQNPDTKDYILVFKATAIRHAVKIFTNWTSGNEKIDDLIQEMRLNFNGPSDILFEWIPYNKFNSVEVKSSPIKTHGVTQNSDTKDYIIVSQNECRCEKCGKLYTYINLKWCKQCQRSYSKTIIIWTSGNEKIDNLIQEIQSKINITFEWIPYNQFKHIKEIGKDVRVYKAIWKDGSLCYDNNKNEYARNQNEEVSLKCLYGSQNLTYTNNILLNEVISYYSNNQDYSMPGIYGISQNPDTNDFILVFQHYKTTTIRYTMKILANWISGNEKIDELIQKMQLKIHERSDTVFEWISYTIFLNKNKMKIRLSIKK